MLKDQDKWFEWLVLKNAMRATSVRAELLFRVIEEACKRKVIGKKTDQSLEAAELAWSWVRCLNHSND